LFKGLRGDPNEPTGLKIFFDGLKRFGGYKKGIGCSLLNLTPDCRR
jgi:hypothetical protein